MFQHPPVYLHMATAVVFSLVAGTALSASQNDVPVSACVTAPSNSDSPPAPFKLTVGGYRVSAGDQPAGPGLDVNLRYAYGSGKVWVGWFRSPVVGFSQLRTGWDRTVTIGPVRLLPSLQAASGGFVGGSIALETGDSWFVGAGLGRTNLHDYVNLNFDPNDSYTAYGGYRWPDSSALSLQLVRDNRLHPDQHVHLIWSQPLPEGKRLIVDVLAKQGTVNGQVIRRTGVSVGFDWTTWFVRTAWDPQVNFTPQNMLRVSTGVRF